MEYTLSSGARLVVTPSSFQEAHGLLKALLKSVKGFPLGPDPLKMDISYLKEALISVAVSDEVEEAMFKCFNRVSYEGVKITKSLFDDLKIGTQLREDYYEICSKVIEENCSPFFKKAFSELMKALGKQPDSPK